MKKPSVHRAPRRGMILPFALIGMLLILTLAASVQLAAWRAQRGAQSQWDAQRGTYEADAAIVRVAAEFPPDSAVAVPIGVRVARPDEHRDGWRVHTTLTRTAPLVVLARAVARREHAGAPIAGSPPDGARVRRTVTRLLNLDVPPLPIRGALTVLGPMAIGGAQIDGRDRFAPYEPDRDDCGPHRDTASIAAVADAGRQELAAPILFGNASTLDTASVDADRRLFDAALARLRPRLVGVSLAADSSLPATPAWQPAVIAGDAPIILDATSHHVGLLVANGDLQVRGALRVEGMLLVDGALDVTEGTLQVTGAVLVRDRHATGTTVMGATHLVYAPCLLQRALGAAAPLSTTRFRLWNSP